MSTPGNGSVASSFSEGRPSSSAKASHEAPTSASSSSRSGEASVTRPPACGATSVLDVSSMRSTSSSSGIGRDPYRPSYGNPDSGRSDADGLAGGHPAWDLDARQHAEALAVGGREVAQQLRPLLARVRVARGDRAALARAVHDEPH